MARHEKDTLDREKIWKDFHEAVNMSTSELHDWLQTEESKSSGWSNGGGETIGHRSGLRIVEIKRMRRGELADEDYVHMRRVVGYVRRHLAQGGPLHDKMHSKWRYSLMNWGHDPLAGDKTPK
jgi:hypothetical protein